MSSSSSSSFFIFFNISLFLILHFFSHFSLCVCVWNESSLVRNEEYYMFVRKKQIHHRCHCHHLHWSLVDLTTICRKTHLIGDDDGGSECYFGHVLTEGLICWGFDFIDIYVRALLFKRIKTIQYATYLINSMSWVYVSATVMVLRNLTEGPLVKSKLKVWTSGNDF